MKNFELNHSIWKSKEEFDKFANEFVKINPKKQFLFPWKIGSKKWNSLCALYETRKYLFPIATSGKKQPIREINSREEVYCKKCNVLFVEEIKSKRIWKHCPKCGLLKRKRITTKQQTGKKEVIKIKELENKNIAYSEYLKTEYWKTLRDFVKQRDGYACVLCGSTKNLNAHHRSYVNKGCGIKEAEDVHTLCEDCHKKFHGIN